MSSSDDEHYSLLSLRSPQQQNSLRHHHQRKHHLQQQQQQQQQGERGNHQHLGLLASGKNDINNEDDCGDGKKHERKRRRRRRLIALRPRSSVVVVVVLVVGFVVLVATLVVVFGRKRRNKAKVMTMTTASSSRGGSETNKPAVTVAYAVSLLKCGDRYSSVVGLTDAALVLRHSVHQTSVRSNNNGASFSRYDYKMYALVHGQAVNCSRALRAAGYTVLVKDPPVRVEEIKGEYLRNNIRREWCCGADEFIKLYAYCNVTFREPIVVHVDMDFIFVKPMDALFDAMLLSSSTAAAVAAEARSGVVLERPDDPWPEGDVPVRAFGTRDWPQVLPGRRPGFQAGLLVVRPDAAVFNELISIVREGDYVPGFQRANGWSGAGHGQFLGSMAMQGLIAYYYDAVRNSSSDWMELNQCRYNHMGMDVTLKGKCRNNQPRCEDCRNTNFSDIYNIHYTQCRKPWACRSLGTAELGRRAPDLPIPEHRVHLSHCLRLQSYWHGVRDDLEDRLFELTGDDDISKGRAGTYKRDVFYGHCRGELATNYTPISVIPSTLERLAELYGD